MAINRNSRQFTDINLLFTAHPSTKDINVRVNEDAVKASIRNLISTRNFERPFHPEIGCQIYSLLFEPFTPIVSRVLKRTITDAINKFEPRVNILNIKLRDNTDNNEISVEITFKIVNTEKPLTLRTAITRVR